MVVAVKELFSLNYGLGAWSCHSAQVLTDGFNGENECPNRTASSNPDMMYFRCAK
jgi:hypothetical protein